MNWETVIGLEVHAELKTVSKMFCGCPVVDVIYAPPNSAVCPVCLGMPGALPVVNQQAVELGIRAALALDCEIKPSVSLPARIISTRTCPKDIRSHNTKNLWRSTALDDQDQHRGKSSSASAGHTWKKIPAS